MDRPTFSQSWSRVSRLTPTLRPQVRIHRQLFHGEPWHIVHDPVTNNFFRLNPVAYHLVGLLDGRRSVDEVWRLTLDRFGDSAPTQNEVIGLLGQLNESNLLRVDLPADAAPLLKRQTRRRLQEIGAQFMSILSLKFPLFNPNRLSGWLQPIFRPVLSKAGLIAWFAWIIVALAYFLPSFRGYVNDMGSVLDPNNWLWMGLVFLLIKSWHELGHAVVCKRFGGEVPEVGIMLLVFFPAPYVDATSSWNFPSKWRRLLVGAAGMMFELVVAGAAVFVWLYSEPNSLPRQLAYNAIFLASITTLLFNANPLLRFDGYYMLSDLLEIPNLYERSGRHLQWLAQHYVFGMRNAQPATTVPKEGVILVLYGICSQIYKLLVIFGIAMFVASKVPLLGIVIGIWGLIAWVMVPAVKFVYWLITNPALYESRARAIVATVVFTVAVVVGLGLVPAPDRRRAEGVVESANRADLAMETEGFVTDVRAEEGQYVKAGQVILVADNPELLARRRDFVAQIEHLEVERRAALAKDVSKREEEDPKIQALQEAIKDLDTRLDGLTLRSPESGVISGGQLHQLQGQFLKRGQVVGQVNDMGALRVTALLDQAHNDTLFRAGFRRVELRTAGMTALDLDGKLVRKIPGAREDLPHPALGYPAGGGIPTRPDDPKGLKTLRPQFEVWIALPDGVAKEQQLIPGERVHVRLTLAKNNPLVFQWAHILEQVIRDRLAM